MPRFPLLSPHRLVGTASGLALAALLICGSALGAPSTRDETTSDGRVRVKSTIAEHRTAGGKSAQSMRYSASMTSDVALKDVVAVLEDVPLHGILIEEKTTRVEKRLGPNRWLIYYFFDMPWPLADADLAAIMTAERAADGSAAVFRIRAAPDALPHRGVSRMNHYDITYRATRTPDNKTQLVQIADVAPSFEVPEFMIRQYFPDGPADVLRRLEKLARVKKAGIKQ